MLLFSTSSVILVLFTGLARVAVGETQYLYHKNAIIVRDGSSFSVFREDGKSTDRLVTRQNSSPSVEDLEAFLERSGIKEAKENPKYQEFTKGMKNNG